MELEVFSIGLLWLTCIFIHSKPAK